MHLKRSECGPAYGFLDPHGGQSDLKRIGSRSAIVVACADPIGRIFVLHSWAGRDSTSFIMSKMERIIEQYGIKAFGVEKNGLAGLWADAMRVNAQLRMKRLPIVKVQQPTNQEKDWRIKTILHPLISRGMLFLQEDQVELHNEIVSFPMSTRKDLVDALASVVRHMIPPVVLKAEANMRKDAVLKYLRDTGASDRQIEAYMREKGRLP